MNGRCRAALDEPGNNWEERAASLESLWLTLEDALGSFLYNGKNLVTFQLSI